MANLNEKNTRYANRRKQTTRRRKFLTVLGCVVVIATAAALLVPALSMTREELTCGFEEHTHSSDCYTQVLVCGQEETEGHVHTDACYEQVLACGLEEGEDHEHSDACYEAQLICGQEETEGHVHSAACYEEQLTCDTPEHTHTEACYSHEKASDKKDEVKMPAVDFEQKIERIGDSAIVVKVKAPESAFPEGTTMEAKLVANNKMDDVEDKVKEAIEREIGEEAKIKEMTAVDIAFKDKIGKEIEPAKNVEVKITTDDVREYDNPMLVHVLDKSKESSNGKSDDAEVINKVKIVDGEGAYDDDNTMKFESKAFSPYVIVELETISAGVITADGEAYTVSVSYGSEAGIPEGAQLRVEELVEASPAWTNHVELLEEELNEKVGFARLFDITIVDKDGYEVQPAKPVKVKIELDNASDLGDNARVAHFADDSDSIDVFDANLSGDTVAFNAESFSVYAVIGDPEPTARMKLEFHAAHPTDGDTVVATMYVKESDTPDNLEMIIYDPNVSACMKDGEYFRGWTTNKNYTVANATTRYDASSATDGAMSIEDIRNWVIQKQQEGITEGDHYEFYAMFLHSYTIQYLDPEGNTTVATDAAYMLREQTEASYEINKTYTPTDTQHYNFEGWIIKDTAQQNLVDYDGDLKRVEDEYDLYEYRMNVTVSGDVTFNAYAPFGNWLIYHEVKKGATYQAAQFLHYNESAELPTADDMSLLGYKFTGWYTHYDDTQDPAVYSGPVESLPDYDSDNGTLTIWDNTDLYAAWEPVEWAPYTIVIWKEDLDQSDPSNKSYSYAESIRCWGPVNQPITIGDSADGSAMVSKVDNNDADYLYVYGQDEAENYVTYDKKAEHDRTPGTSNVKHTYTNRDYVGFNCVGFKSDAKDAPWITDTTESVTINPEGNSIINVYYDRIEYTVKIYFANTTTLDGSNYYHLYHYRSNTPEADATPLGPDHMRDSFPYNVSEFPLQPRDGHALVIGDDYDVDTGADGKNYYYIPIKARYGENIAEKWPEYFDYPDMIITHGGSDGPNGQKLTMVSWYMSSEAEGYRGSGSGLNTFKGIITIMDEKILGDISVAYDRNKQDLRDYQNILVARYDPNVYYYKYEIWKEQIPDVDYSGYQTKEMTIRDNDDDSGSEPTYTTRNFYLSEDDCFVAHSSAKTGDTATQAPVYRGFENLKYGSEYSNASTTGPGSSEDNPATCVFYYERIKNPIVYRDGSYYNDTTRLDYPALGEREESNDIYYEAGIASYGPTGKQDGTPGDNYKTDYKPSYPGFVFEGWYMDAECKTPYPFGTYSAPAKMPDHPITVYAKFRQVQYRVFLHPQVPTDIPDDVDVNWGNASQKMNFRVSYGGTVSEPTGFLEYETGGIYEGYEFGGWYLDKDYKYPFLGSAFPLNDTISQLKAYDKTDPTDDMDKYGNIDPDTPHPSEESGPGYNSDKWEFDESTGEFTYRDRWWISKKLDIYAKWNVRLQQSNIQVEYDPNGGTMGDPASDAIFVDPSKYKDNADAIAWSAPDPSDPSKEVFRYWVLQKWVEDQEEPEGGKFVDVDPLEFVSPSDLFKIDAKKYAHIYEEDGEMKYVMRLRAEYGPLKEETPTHIYWYSNFGDNEYIKINTTEEGEQAELFKINEAVLIKPANTFSRNNFKFLGWARNNSTDAQGNPEYDADHAPLHPEFGEGQLFLKYENGVFKAENKDGDWVEVTYVAADEVLPYHDLYAVWAIDLEIVKTDDGTTPIEGAMFDLYQKKNGAYTEKVATVDLTDRTSMVVSNLLEGDYQLVETTIPDGYIVTGDVYFTIDSDGIVTVTSTTEISPGVRQAYEDNEKNPQQVIVRNKPGTALPNTGGPGTALFYIVGTTIAILAICIYCFGSRRGRERRSRE